MTINKQLHSRILICIAIALVGMAGTIAGLRMYKNHTKEVVAAKSEGLVRTQAPKVRPIVHVYSLPNRLRIPKLSIDASILPMGVTSSGAMESPKTNQDTGWYSLGVRPGNEGSAVIAGHLGLKNEAVFGKLNLLSVGDTLSIVDDQGVTVSFEVDEVQEYNKDSDTTKIFNSNEGAHLNLITCNGNWESSQSTYDKRLIVFTHKI